MLMPAQHQIIEPTSWAKAIKDLMGWATDTYGIWIIVGIAAFALAWHYISARKRQ